MSPEPRSNQELEPVELRSTATSTAAQVWDSFADALGYSPETKAERGKWNGAIRDWRAAGLGAADVPPFVAAYRALFRDLNANPRAITNHVGELRPIVDGTAVPSGLSIAPGDHAAQFAANALEEIKARGGNGNGHTNGSRRTRVPDAGEQARSKLPG